MQALVAALLTAILGAFGLGGKVERGVERQLRQQLGDVGQVKVDIHRGHRSPLSRQVDRVEITLVDFDARSLPSSGLRIGGGGDLVGKVGTVAIHARNFRVDELAVERLDVTIKDIRYDLWKAIWRRKLEIIRVGDSHAEAFLQARALTGMLAPRIKRVRNFQLTFGSGDLTVTGDARVGVRIPVRLTCGLAALGDGRIYAVDPRAHVSVIPVPSFIISRLMDQINPVADLNQGGEGPFEFAIDEIRISPRHVLVRANLIVRKRE